VHEGKEQELRVHVWHSSLRRAGIEESGLLHDHRFNLYSQVLVGEIRQEEYELITHIDGSGDWQLHEVVHARAVNDRHGANDGLMTALPQRYTLDGSVRLVNAGQAYFFPKRVFHGTFIEDPLVVTLVTKSDQEDAPARILAPYGMPVVHAFADPMPELEWQHVLNEAADALMKAWKA
jgi:hypothetical protein